MGRRRGLGPEDLEAWAAVARSTRPLRPRGPPSPAPEAAMPALPPTPPPVTPAVPAPLAPFRLGDRAAAPRPATADQSPVTPLRMDAGAFARMTRGKLAPEARIDLHGMTLAEAHGDLIGFVLGAQMQGLRLVLVVTGKGRGANGPGALPRQVPHWLRLPPLAQAVLQVTEAHARHGGARALYVYLSRRR